MGLSLQPIVQHDRGNEQDNMNNSNRHNRLKTGNRWMRPISAIVMLLSLGIVPGVGAEEKPDLAKLVGQPAELSAWAYAYRADRNVQEKPEACFVLRRLERLDRAYRPVSLLLSQGNEKKGMPWPKLDTDWQLLPKKDVWERGKMLPAPSGVLKSALLWEGRMHFNRLELHWPKKDQTPPLQSVELRVYPSWYGWFGWQSDQQVTVKPEISEDGSTWVYKGDWDGVDMVAVFVQPAEEAKCGVPQILAYGPEVWKRMDVEIEWGFKAGTQTGGLRRPSRGILRSARAKPRLCRAIRARRSRAGMPGNRTPAAAADAASPCRCSISNRRMSLSGTCRSFPTAIRATRRITVWTKSGSFTFLVRDLEKGPILAPEYGFFVAKAGSGKNAREFAAELAAANAKSIREMTREHREATWEEAMREIKLPMLPPEHAAPAVQAGGRSADAGRGARDALAGRLADGRIAIEERRTHLYEPCARSAAADSRDGCRGPARCGRHVAGRLSATARHPVRRRFQRRVGQFLHRQALSRHGDHRLPRLRHL